MTKIRTDRLLKLADYLKTVPRKRFDMMAFGVTDECGFSGCAMGWAVHGKLFRGLRWAGHVGERMVLNGADTPHQVAKRIRTFVRDHEKANT